MQTRMTTIFKVQDAAARTMMTYRRLSTLSTSLFVLGLVTGCSTKDATVEVKSGPNPGGTEAVHLEKIAFADRAKLIENMKRELSGIEQETKRLSASVDASSAVSNAEAKTRLDAVRGKWTEAKKELAEAEGATESTWDDVQGSFKTAYGDLKDSFEDTRRWMSEKIEP